MARPLTRAHHNCSGKHAGFLTDARQLGVDPAGCQRPDHPVQRRVLATIAEMAGVDRERMPVAVDGCTAPAVALPLGALATAVARIADPTRLARGRAAAARRLDAAVKAKPLYVAGTGRACTALIQAAGGAASVKTGAEGVFVAAISSLGLGVALEDRRRRDPGVGDGDRGVARGDGRGARRRRRRRAGARHGRQLRGGSGWSAPAVGVVGRAIRVRGRCDRALTARRGSRPR